jgi:hypothetical protein
LAGQRDLQRFLCNLCLLGSLSFVSVIPIRSVTGTRDEHGI